MNIRKKIGMLSLVGTSLILLWGCSGDTDGGAAGEEDFAGSQYDGEDAGSIEVDLDSTTIETSGLSSFIVKVRDTNGDPVPNISVSCDSEEGVAILEPTTGAELTDDFGNMSGSIGCESPGSFQFGCRLPIGANKRDFVSVKCEGDVPTGFTGFPGAAGGGLGGGVSDSGDGGTGGTNPEGVRVLSIVADDSGSGGSTATTSIDTQAATCDDGSTEPFFDTTLTIKVVNSSNSTIRFTSMNYSVDNATGAGTAPFNSRSLSLIGDATALGGGDEALFTVLAFDISGSRKAFVGPSSDTTIALSLGFRNVTVRLVGTNDQGDSVTVTGRTTLSFDDFDNCD